VSGGQKRGPTVVLHKHTSHSHCKMGAQVRYLICDVDTGRGAAVQEELHGLYARTSSHIRGGHQHSPSNLDDKGREDAILLIADRRA
jgi:hypothetical protein